MSQGAIEIRLLRWHDHCAFYDFHTGALNPGVEWYWSAFQWEDERCPNYRPGGWVAVQSYDFRQDLENLQRFAQNVIQVQNFQTERHSPARQIEALDWPLFYGVAHTDAKNPFEDSWCFTTTQYEPNLLALRCDADGHPKAGTTVPEREAFLRARQLLEQFGRTLTMHCAVEKALRLPGPDLEDWRMEKAYDWDRTSSEERRRKRLGSLGTPVAANGRPLGQPPGECTGEDEVTHDDVERVIYNGTDSKGRKIAPYTADEGFSAAFQAARMRRQAKAAK